MSNNCWSCNHEPDWWHPRHAERQLKRTFRVADRRKGFPPVQGPRGSDRFSLYEGADKEAQHSAFHDCTAERWASLRSTQPTRSRHASERRQRIGWRQWPPSAGSGFHQTSRTPERFRHSSHLAARHAPPDRPKRYKQTTVYSFPRHPHQAIVAAVPSSLQKTAAPWCCLNPSMP